MKQAVWQFATAGNIRFGRGSHYGLCDELDRLGIERPLVVTDKTIRALPGMAGLWQTLQQRRPSARIFEGGEAEPAVGVAEAAILAGREVAADGVIALGGGSNIDVAKIAGIVLKHGGTPRDYFGFDRIPGPGLPLIALPTTAGTGSEVSHSAVLSDPCVEMKVSTLSRWLRPATAIVDPVLTDSCPKMVNAHSGIDALVHAIEAYTNREYVDMGDVDPQARAYEGSYPFTRMLAAEAIRNISRYIVRAYQYPADHEARDGMAYAAMLAGMAFSNSGVALVHALEYPIGIRTHCSHGEGNGLLLPHVMRFNLSSRQQAMLEIYHCLQPEACNEGAAEAAIEEVVALQQALGIRQRLRDLGLSRGDIPEMARKAFQIKRLMDINPRVPDEEDLRQILEAAY
jgi:alcohol dehydrogenase class IV